MAPATSEALTVCFLAYGLLLLPMGFRRPAFLRAVGNLSDLIGPEIFSVRPDASAIDLQTDQDCRDALLLVAVGKLSASEASNLFRLKLSGAGVEEFRQDRVIHDLGVLEFCGRPYLVVGRTLLLYTVKTLRGVGSIVEALMPRSFTLIELVGWIAIIAILAAILSR